MQVERGREVYQDGREASPCGTLPLPTGQVRRAMKTDCEVGAVGVAGHLYTNAFRERRG